MSRIMAAKEDREGREVHCPAAGKGHDDLNLRVLYDYQLHLFASSTGELGSSRM
jgi:hypothetical protein